MPPGGAAIQRAADPARPAQEPTAGDLLGNACRQAWWIGQLHTTADVVFLDVTQAVLIEWDLERGQMATTHWSPRRGLW